MGSRRSTLVYVAGPYSSSSREGIAANIARARSASVSLWRAGFSVFTPHLNTAWFNEDCPEVPWDEWLQADLLILVACKAMVMLPGWGLSKGARFEKETAEGLGIPVYYSLAGLCEAFKEGEEAID
jgi:hypothetical protein